MAEGYTIKSIDEFEEMEGSGGSDLAPRAQVARVPRRSASTSSTSRPAARSPRMTTPATTRRRSSSSWRVEGKIVTDGEEHDAPAGTFCRFAPEVNRTIRNESDANVRALLIGVPVDSGYEQMPWG